MKHIALAAAIAALGFSAAADAATIGTDDASASAYTGGFNTGTNGSTSGNGFGAWTITANQAYDSNNNQVGYAGTFIGNSTDIGADINTNGKSFMFYENGDASANVAASRSFSSPLTAGQTFSIKLVSNYNDGNRGISIQDGLGNNILNLNDNGGTYSINDTASSNGTAFSGYDANTIVSLSVTQTSATGGTFSITRSGGTSAGPVTGSYTGVAAGLNLYLNGVSFGATQNEFGFNSLSVVPEPASLALLGLGGMTALRRRRK